MFNTLRSKIFLVFAAIIFITTISMVLVIQVEVRETLLVNQDEQAANLLKTVMLNVDNEYKSLLFHEKSVMDRRKSELKNLTNLAMQMIENHYNRFLKGEISEAEAKQRSIEEIRTMRYDDRVGYFWINDTGKPYPKMVVHTVIPDLEGKILDDPKFNCAGNEGKNLFVLAAEIGVAKGEGTIDYLWPKPTKDGLTQEQPKISYVKLFKEWNWIVGTGVYIDDIEEETQKRLDAILSELKVTFSKVGVANSGYLFLFTSDKKFLIFPNLEDNSGEQLINPITNRSLLDELIEASKTPDSAHVYLWDKPDHPNDFRYKKQAYTAYFEPLDWYISASYYRNEVEIPVNEFRSKIIMLAALFMVVAFLASLYFSKVLTTPISEIAIASERIADGDFEVSFSKTRIKEIDSLAGSLVNMGSKLDEMATSLLEEKEHFEKSEEKFRFLTENMADIIWTLDQDFKTTYISPSVARILGFESKQLMSKSLREMITPETFKQFEKQLTVIQKKALPSSNSAQPALVVEVQYYHADGSTVWMENSIKLLLDDAKKIVGYYGSSRDITGRKLAQEKTHEMMQFNEMIIAKSPVGIAIYDEDGICIEANHAMAKLTGQPREAILFHDYHTFDVYRGANLEELAEIALFENNLKRKEFKLTNLKGAVLDVECQLVPLLIGKKKHLMLIATDMTEHKRMQEVMVQSEKMLSVGGLAAGMAHEINNPLAGIMQSAYVINDRLKNLDLPANKKVAAEIGISLDSIREYMEKRNIFRMQENIIESGKRAAEIIGNMLSFARKGDSTFSTKDIAKLVEQTLTMAASDYDLKKNYDFKQIKIIREFQEDLPKVSCESVKIQQVFLNILRNGAEAMQEAKDKIEDPCFIVRVLQDSNPKYIRIEIEDNGPGMTESVRKRIFEPFFTTKPTDKGTGLGLSVSYFIISENHDGEMTVESRLGKGANFIIKLPLVRSEAG